MALRGQGPASGPHVCTAAGDRPLMAGARRAPGNMHSRGHRRAVAANELQPPVPGRRGRDSANHHSSSFPDLCFSTFVPLPFKKPALFCVAHLHGEMMLNEFRDWCGGKHRGKKGLYWRVSSDYNENSSGTSKRVCLEKTAVTVKTTSDNLQGACMYMPASTLQPAGSGGWGNRTCACAAMGRGSQHVTHPPASATLWDSFPPSASELWGRWFPAFGSD